MARRKGIDQKIQTTRGFVTEFTSLSFPQEAAIDIDNCIIDSDGSVRRRPGIDFEQGFVLNKINQEVITTANLATIGMSTHLWKSVNNSGTLSIVVQQVGNILTFFSQEGAVSAGFLGSISMVPFAISNTTLGQERVQTASGLGNLYVVSKSLQPIRISFDGIVFSVTPITLKVRDLIGIEPDASDLTIIGTPTQDVGGERLTTITAQHRYNLLNQGWNIVNLSSFKAEEGVYPNNADIMSVGIVVNASGNVVFDSSFILAAELGNTPAPKGHFLLDAFNKDYESAISFSGFDPEEANKTVDARPEAVAFHQGRIFYSAPAEEGEVVGVFYSQQLTTVDKEGNCYQEADPTAPDIHALVDTDGGFLPIPGAGQILSLREVGNGIAVIATNGVWFLTGAEAISGLSATNIRLIKVSSAGALSASSVVEAESSIFYFGVDGVMQLQTEGQVSVVNITQSSIQNFYINISAKSRQLATVTYIPEQRKIYWSYTDAAASASPSGVGHDTFLILDFEIQGYYKYSINTTEVFTRPEIVGLVHVQSLTQGTVAEDVTKIDGTVITNIALEDITVDKVQDSGQITQLKVATMAFSVADNGYKITFSTFRSRAFTDWRAVDNIGIPMVSFVEFAEFNMGAVHTKGHPTYVHSFFSKDSKNLDVGSYYELPPLS